MNAPAPIPMPACQGLSGNAACADYRRSSRSRIGDCETLQVCDIGVDLLLQTVPIPNTADYLHIWKQVYAGRKHSAAGCKRGFLRIPAQALPLRAPNGRKSMFTGVNGLSVGLLPFPDPDHPRSELVRYEIFLSLHAPMKRACFPGISAAPCAKMRERTYIRICRDALSDPAYSNRRLINA